MPSESTALTREISLGEFAQNSVDRIRFTITKDGVPWDLTAATVELTFEKPDRETQFTRTMAHEDDERGIIYYDTQTTDDLDEAGWWTLGVTITDGPVVKRYPYPINLEVTEEP